MTETVQNIVTIACPIILSLIVFLYGTLNIARKLYMIFESSNLAIIKQDIKEQQENINAAIQEVLELYKETIKDNAELKKQNKELKEIITKIKEG